jgi:molybdopterin synthase catalytic subunit
MQTFDVLTYQPIDISAVLASFHSPGTGGIVLFSGEVRNANKGRLVRYLEYEAYEGMAKNKILEIVVSAKDRWHLNMALCIHRLGRLEISDCAVLVVTASAHRSEAYEANRYIIDKVKTEVPIWKKEYFEDGTEEWGANMESLI